LTNILNNAFQKYENLENLLNLYHSLQVPLLDRLGDEIENNRELAINILEKFIDTLGVNITNDDFEHIIKSIINRMIDVKPSETCNYLYYFPLILAEEKRLRLLTLLHKLLLNNCKAFCSVISSLCTMIANLLADLCPEIKIKLCEFVTTLSEKHNNALGSHSKQIILSLCKNKNLMHQQNKIRKSSVDVSYIIFKK
jgi:hypothetical protein